MHTGFKSICQIIGPKRQPPNQFFDKFVKFFVSNSNLVSVPPVPRTGQHPVSCLPPCNDQSAFKITYAFSTGPYRKGHSNRNCYWQSYDETYSKKILVRPKLEICPKNPNVQPGLHIRIYKNSI